MPLVTSLKNFQPGDKPTATELNAPYNELATDSAAISGDNAASGWATHRHFQGAANFVPLANACKEYENPTTTETFYNNTSYVTISQGGNPAEITLGYTPEVNELIRFHASGMVGDHVIATDYDYVGANQGKPNYYAFSLLLTTNAGTVNLGEWGYSFTTKKNGALTSTLTQTVASAINWQPFAFSTVYHQATAGVTLQKVALQCKVFSNTNQLSVERHQLYAIRAKR